jgi:ABC-2 type transport system permease protein
MAFTLTAVVLVAASAHVLGTQLFDASAPLPSTSGTSLTTTQSSWRTVLAVLYVGWSMLGVAAVALFLSTVTDSPLAAALGAVALLVASTVLVGLEAAQSVRPVPADALLAGVRRPVPRSRPVARPDAGTLLQGVYVVVFLTAAWANFTTKDVAS